MKSPDPTNWFWNANSISLQCPFCVSWHYPVIFCVYILRILFTIPYLSFTPTDKKSFQSLGNMNIQKYVVGNSRCRENTDKWNKVK